MKFQHDTLKAPRALRVWAHTKDIPEATKQLLQQCSDEDITPLVITLELIEDEWSIIVWGD